MENWMNDYRVESDNKLTCKYCEKIVNRSWLARHVNLKTHKKQKEAFVGAFIIKKIEHKTKKRFNRQYPDLTGEEREEQYFQMKEEAMELWKKAEKDGYFDGIYEPEDFDFADYELYLKRNF